MFSRQTITKDPVSATPTEFDIILLLGWFSYPVAINVTGNEAVLDSTSWHVVDSITVSASTPELLLIPWVAEALGTIEGNAAELTDSLLLGETNVNITLGISGFTGIESELAPSWFVRQPNKNEVKAPWNKFNLLDPQISAPSNSAPINNAKEKIIPWGAMDDLFRHFSSLWDFIPKQDRETIASFQDLINQYESNVATGYTSPATKDLEKHILWDKFVKELAHDISHGYTAPEFKDFGKVVPWDQFKALHDIKNVFAYSHPDPKDREIPIYSGPNWFPKWCERTWETAYGEVVFVWDSEKDQVPSQYFSEVAFEINPQEYIRLPEPLSISPAPENRYYSFPSGGMFGYRPIGKDNTKIEMRGSIGATLNVTSRGMLEFPLYFEDKTSNYDEVCYDGYRTGPQDKYDYNPDDDYIKPTPKADIRSYYIIMNTVTLRRVSDSALIPIQSMSIEGSLDNWCWGFKANLRRREDLDLVVPSGSPVEVEATINGNKWRFIIEDYGESRAFGQRTYSISGRSPSAQLAAPYVRPKSYVQSSQRQAVQLAEEAILNTGFTVDWQLNDWLVPANVYSVTDKTPIQELVTIAAAAGGIVQSAPNTTIISLLPRYATLPWDWGGAIIDASLPSYQNKGVTHNSQVQYNGVYVSGQNQGVSCLIKRTGTDGSEQPQMVTDPLITDVYAAQQLGAKILADSGTREIVNIQAPLFDNPGLLIPGMLISVTDLGVTWRGQVQSVAVSSQRPGVYQDISVMKYLGS